MSEADFHLDNMYEDDPEPVRCRRCGKNWLYWIDGLLVDEDGNRHRCEVKFEPLD